MKTSLSLIGFMGVGKSAVARILAERLKKELVEVDALIEKRAGKSIPQIFQDEGEIRFRELEIETVKEIAAGNNQVIANGGGVVLNKINIDRLKLNSVIIWLTASPTVIQRRTSARIDQRPLLKGLNSTQELQSLIQFRLPFYERAADLIIDTDRLDPWGVANLTITKLKEKENENNGQ